MDNSLMEKVYRTSEATPIQGREPGHIGWLITQVGNLSGYIFQADTQASLPCLNHLEEEFIYVLSGRIVFQDGRMLSTGEGCFNLAGLSHPGNYSGRLLVFRIMPENTSASINRRLMDHVFKYDEALYFYEPKVMTHRRLWLATDNVSVVMNESDPGSTFSGVIHPEKEIVFVIQGQLEYDNGRLVKAGEAIVNLPNLSLPGRRGGNSHICSFEIKAPADPKLLERWRQSGRLA